jgi:hypothetical protein
MAQHRYNTRRSLLSALSKNPTPLKRPPAADDECKREHTCASAQIAEDPYAYREEWEDEDFLSGIAT